LAGPVVAAAVILTPGASYSGVTDSKLMTAEDRERAFRAIMRQCEAVSFAAADAEEIDRVNILQASLTAMTRAVDCLAKRPDFLYIDGNMPIPCPLPQRPLVKGDLRCLSVAAASIVAKVIRDRIMVAYDRLYPDYGFANHKGYATRFHLDAVTRCGPCPIHRRTFNGVQAQDLVSNT
jgi:ribonuclease HII